MLYDEIDLETADAETCFHAGRELLVDGDATETTYHKALRCFTEAARGGVADAWFFAGAMYHNGDGTEKNEPQAVMCFLMGAYAGSAQCMHSLSHVYRENADDKKAFRWIRRAVEASENPHFLCSYADMLMDGTGCRKNTKKAWELLNALMEDGYADAAFLAAANTWKEDPKRSTEYLKQAAEWGNAVAMTLIGDSYAKGEYVRKSKREASKWYHKAVEAGDHVACARLAEAYETGSLGTVDRKKAIKYYRLGAERGFEPCAERLRELEQEAD